MSLPYLHVQRQVEETRTMEPDASDCNKYTTISSKCYAMHIQMLCTSKCFRIHLNTMDAGIPILGGWVWFDRSIDPSSSLCLSAACLCERLLSSYFVLRFSLSTLNLHSYTPNVFVLSWVGTWAGVTYM